MKLLAGERRNNEIAAVNELVPISIKVVDPASIDLARLVAYRKIENALGRQLRHRFRERIDEQIKIVANTSGPRDRNEALRQFESDNEDDFQLLKEALRMKTLETLWSKELLIPIVAGLEAAARLGLDPHWQIGAATIGGLLYAGSKFSSERQKLLQQHPTAYLYETKAGFKL